MEKMYMILGFILVMCSRFSTESPKLFPKNFLFGVSTSAFQTEGAWNIDGKTESNWDYYTHTWPERVQDRSNADIACNSYHKTEVDVKLMKQLGVKLYRFSISWNRILPHPLTNNANQAGISHYKKFLQLLVDNGIEPLVTLFHWDLPYRLEQLGGFMNPMIIEAFVRYAKVAFENFGDKVQKWTTFNEPHSFCTYGYADGLGMPEYNVSGMGNYLCAYHILKAHAAVYHLYNDTFKPTQKGGVSISLNSEWYEPASNAKEDIEAADRALQFRLGIYAHPIYTKTGDYPEVVKNHIAERSKAEGYTTTRLPLLTKEEIAYIRGTYDYFFLNHYSTYLAANKAPTPIGIPSHVNDMNVYNYHDPSWPPMATPNKWIVPWGFLKILVWIKEQYENPEIYVTENGAADIEGLNDKRRIMFYKLYLNAALDAINEHNVRLKGYCTWSLMDNFQWLYGYVTRFGLYHVNFTDPERPRTPRASARYYKEVIATRNPNL